MVTLWPLWAMEGLTDGWGAVMRLLWGALVLASVQHAIVLALAVRRAPEGGRATAMYGDPAEVRTLLLPLVVLTLVLGLGWPGGGWLLALGLTELLLAYQHGGVKERKPVLVPNEANTPKQ